MNRTSNTKIDCISKSDTIFAVAKRSTKIIVLEHEHKHNGRAEYIEEGTQILGIGHWDTDKTIFLMVIEINGHDLCTSPQGTELPFDTELSYEDWNFRVLVPFEKEKSCPLLPTN